MLRSSLLLCAAALLAAPVAASADTASGIETASPLQIEEWSAASKPKRKRAVTIYRNYPPYPAYGWRVADPSFDQYGRPYRNPFPGQCMIDLGYGRWESCSQVR